MENVYFKPWIGKFYENGGCFNKRVMILGDSHYCNEPCLNECGIIKCKKDPFTTKVISDFLSGERGNWSRSFTSFENAIFNKELSQEETDYFWNSVLFYNYLQKAMGDAGIKPDNSLYVSSFSAFNDVVKEFKPDLIIAWGYRLYDNLSVHNKIKVETMKFNDNENNNFLEDGNGIKVYCIRHPSRYFERDYWHEIIQKIFDVNNVVATLE